MDLKEILSVSLILFSVIDMIGNVPLVISLRKQGMKIQSAKATVAAGVLMIGFLYGGQSILKLFGLDVASFAIAGSIVIFIIGLEMVLGITIFKESPESSAASIVPIAFPLIAGAGTLTTILSLRSHYESPNILIGILLNLIFVFVVLRSSDWIQNKIGKNGTDVLRKIFGIILLAIAVKLFKSNLGL